MINVGSQDKQKVILLNRDIPLIITVIVDASVTAAGDGGMIPEVKPFFFQPGSGHFNFSAGIKGVQDAAIFSKCIVDFTDIFVGFAVAAVVVGAAALIGAEPFIDSA